MTKGQQLFDHKKIDINTAKLKTHGQVFEIVVDPDLAIAYKQGKKDLDKREVLKAQEIFADANKGLMASETEVEKVFGTTEPLEVAEQILQKGDIQLTSDYREKVRQEKKNKILDTIHRNGVDPRNNSPHPRQRLENAFHEANIHIDEFKKARDQVDEIVKKLTPILPISFEKKQIEVKVDSQHATRLYGRIQSMAKIKKEEWLNDGSWFAIVEIPAGLQDDFFDELNKETHGEVETKILGKN